MDLYQLSIAVLLAFTVCLPPTTTLEGQPAVSHKQGIVRSGVERVKRQADNSDLVVDVTYKMKRNKSIAAFSEEEKENMLHVHNAYRSLVRPLAANMVELTWDDDIAAFAQEWAEQCTATHRPNRDLDPWINMGENLYWWYSGKYNEAMSVKWWWDEIEYYTIQSQYCVPGKVCSHYVTMAWAKSEKVGCGVNRCDRLWDLPDYGRGAYYFVCSYSGRFLSNTKPYQATDIPCSACHNTDFPKCRYNLCVTQEMIDNDIGYNGSTTITGLTRSETYSSPKTPTTTTTEPEPPTTTTTITTEPEPTTPTTTSTETTMTTTEETTTQALPSTTTTQQTTDTSATTTTTTSIDNNNNNDPDSGAVSFFSFSKPLLVTMYIIHHNIICP